MGLHIPIFGKVVRTFLAIVGIVCYNAVFVRVSSCSWEESAVVYDPFNPLECFVVVKIRDEASNLRC